MPNPIIRRLLDNLRWTPKRLPGLQLWLRADAGLYQSSAFTTPATADADPVGGWRDQSGRGYHALQGTAGKRPSLKLAQQRGLPSVRTDGIDDFLSIASFPLPTLCSLFVVGKFPNSPENLFIEHSVNGGSTDGAYWTGTQNSPWAQTRTATNRYVGTASWIGSAWCVASFVYDGVGTGDGAGGSHYLNGTAQTRGAVTGTPRSNTTVTDTLYIASRAGTSLFSVMDFGELLIVASAVSPSNRQRTERYLGQRWGITVA